jgi:hypothetical protein
VLGLSASAARADVTFSDGEFTVVDWALAVTSTTGGATQSTTRSTLDGNPTAYRRTVHIMPVNSSIRVAHVYQHFYDPAASGAITSVDHQEDRRQEVPPFVGAVITSTPLVVQGGVYYYGPTTTFGQITWATYTRTGLVANDYTWRRPRTRTSRRTARR